MTMTGLIELPAAGQPSAGTARNRGISYHGNLGRVLRDLTGFATLMFELLQNADDAGATTVRIDVGRDALVVVNDAVFSDCGNQDLLPEDCLYLAEFGHRCDFHSFREVASGDKRDRADTTGAFGIGFTAVYQVADTAALISNRILLGPHRGAWNARYQEARAWKQEHGHLDLPRKHP